MQGYIKIQVNLLQYMEYNAKCKTNPTEGHWIGSLEQYNDK